MQGLQEELKAELLAQFGDRLRFEAPATDYFARLQARFVTLGSKIDWDKVPGARVESVAQGSSEQFVADGLRFVETARAELKWPDDAGLILVGTRPWRWRSAFLLTA